MRTTRRFITLFFCISVFLVFTGVSAYAHSETGDSHSAKGLIRFTENKGQWDDVVTYRAEVQGGALFLEKKGFTYAFVNTDDLKEIHPQTKDAPPGGFPIRMHAVKVHFENALDPVALSGTDADEGYSNYFIGNDPSHWASYVKTYQKVSYQRVYPGVDMRVYSNYGSLKYDFIVSPNSNTNQIRLRYEGADNIYLTSEGHLNVHTSLGSFTEQKPYAYQIIGGQEKEVECHYALANNVLTFDFPKGFDTQTELIIDPTLIFSTLTGSTADNWGNTATYDDLGNFYTGGMALSAGYPTTAGAYRTTFVGSGLGGGNGYYLGDVSITKYNPTGTARIFSTYLGGSDNEQPTSLVVNKNGELFVLGKTYSTNFPTTAGAFDQTSNGMADIFITKFNAAGSALLGSTYVGGSGDDGVNISSIWSTISFLKYNYCDDLRSDIFVDANDDVYIADNTQSANFPVLAAFKGAMTGTQDGVVFKMSGSLTTMRWSSFIGGSAYDAAYSIVLDNANNVVVCGGTNSTNLPVTAGAYHATNSGGVDGYIAKIANTAAPTILACTYIGTSSFDQSWLVQTDKNDNIYVLGTTEGVYPISAGVYSNPNSSQFIHKLNSTLTTSVYSTVFGSGVRQGNISITAFLVDFCENLYVAGWGRKAFYPYPSTSVVGMPITANAYQSNPHDGNDFYFMQMAKNASSLLYGTYFGGSLSQEHVDGGTCRFDKNGTLYISVCAACGASNDFPTTPGVVSTTNGSSNCNNGSIKMKFDFNQVRAVFNIPPINKGCAPFNVNFNNSSILGVDFMWYFGDGDSTNLPNPSHLYINPGTYTVMLVATNQNTCNIYDTAYSFVVVYPDPIANAGPDKTICFGDVTSLTASGGSTYSWTPSLGLTPANVASPNASPPSTTNYVVTVTDVNGCTDIDTAAVFVNPLPPANAGPDKTICLGFNDTLSASGGIGYAWNPDPTLSSTVIANPVANPTATTTYIVTVTDANSCTAQDTVMVIVNPNLTVLVSPADAICFGTTSQITSSGGAIYSWSPGIGLNDSTISNPIAAPSSTTLYSLYVTDGNGCKGTGSTTINVNPLPVAVASPDTTVCIGTFVQLTSSGGASFLWSPATYLSSDTVSNPSATPLVTTTYQLIVTDANGCKDTTVTTINVNTYLAVNAGPDAPICIGDTTQLNAVASGGAVYAWTPATGLDNPNIANPNAFPTATTTYAIDVSNSTGCNGSDSITVFVNPLPLVGINPVSAVCRGFSTIITASGGANYAWSPPTGLSNPNIPNPTAAPSTATSYTVTVTDVNGCISQNSTTVNVNSIIVNISPNVSYCIGSIAQLTATGGSVYSWTPPVGLDLTNTATPNASPTVTTVYTVDVTDTNGCRDIKSVTITVIPGPTVDAGPDHEICVGESVQLFAAGIGTTYTWSPPVFLNSSTIQGPVSTPLTSLSYAVTASSGSSCPDATDTVSIIVHPIPSIAVSADTSIMAGTTITLTAAGGGVIYEWSPSTWLNCTVCPSPSLMPLKTTTYFVRTTDANGCVNNDTVTVYVDDILTLYVPSAFTPYNYDASNNVFYVYGLGIFQFEFYIFDRWGTLVFETNDPLVGWDGTFKGKVAVQDTYAWLAKATSITGKTISKTGAVTLIR